MMTLEQFIPLVTSKPASFINSVTKGTIEVGKDADFVIWNPDEANLIKEEDVFLDIKLVLT